jgi:hypothetical protein
MSAVFDAQFDGIHASCSFLLETRERERERERERNERSRLIVSCMGIKVTRAKVQRETDETST